MAEKRTGAILFVLLILSILFLTFCPPIQYRKRIQVKLTFANEGITTVAGPDDGYEPRHVDFADP